MTRPYRLGRRKEAVDRTASSILEAARLELQQTPARQLSIGAVARRAGVTRATVYNRFGTRHGLIRALVPLPAAPAAVNNDPREAVHAFLASRCARWAADPALYRGLGSSLQADDSEDSRRLAEELARADRLRPGCSIKEAQDVLGALASFPVFDRLHQDGRRSPGACTEILMRLAGGILA
ncbi:MAG TPA: helix-turn-helix domain-containing protein [Candidatus Dormibacteraeota bacterium]|nr:helix-turn-helix domain-containing protein [Candidatus Dormibacteraeota bacterium]